MDWILSHYNFITVVALLMLGLWGMIAQSNLVKKCIALAIFQTGIILFFISMGAKMGATIPIIDYHAAHGAHDAHMAIQATHYANPLTQILMLTAIVVGVATLGVALVLAQKVYKTHGSLEEPEILESIKE